MRGCLRLAMCQPRKAPGTQWGEFLRRMMADRFPWQLDMADGDVLEVHQEQIGGSL